MIVLIIVIVVFEALGVLFIVSFVKSKGLYDDYVESLDKKEYSFKDLIPIGLFINGKFNARKVIPRGIYKYSYIYENEIKNRISELYGVKYASYYLMIHNGNKTAVSLTLAAGAALLSVITGIQGDKVNCMFFLFASFAFLIGMHFLLDKSLNDKIKKRRIAIQMEFPDFINKLTLLVNAGMTISKAWEKIVVDNTKDTPLYNEMSYALGEIRAGKPEAVAYEEFGRRCKVKEIVRFVSVIILNLKKGGSDVVPMLKVQATECWEMRKNAAR